jgi:hypothetical protein
MKSFIHCSRGWWRVYVSESTMIMMASTLTWPRCSAGGASAPLDAPPDEPLTPGPGMPIAASRSPATTAAAATLRARQRQRADM